MFLIKQEKKEEEREKNTQKYTQKSHTKYYIYNRNILKYEDLLRLGLW